jgi:hypothetical protein
MANITHMVKKIKKHEGLRYRSPLLIFPSYLKSDKKFCGAELACAS